MIKYHATVIFQFLSMIIWLLTFWSMFVQIKVNLLTLQFIFSEHSYSSLLQLHVHTRFAHLNQLGCELVGKLLVAKQVAHRIAHLSRTLFRRFLDGFLSLICSSISAFRKGLCLRLNYIISSSSSKWIWTVCPKPESPPSDRVYEYTTHITCSSRCTTCSLIPNPEYQRVAVDRHNEHVEVVTAHFVIYSSL